jgi:hypothetical protein
MVVPLLPAGEEHLLHAGLLQPSAAAAVLHAAGYLLVTGSIAVVVYHRLGLRLLRTAWINLDLLWGLALLLTAGTVAVAG